MKVQRLTVRGWLVVLALLGLAILLGWGIARVSAMSRRPLPTGHGRPARGVHKSCTIRPVSVLEAGARAVVTKYYVTATATDVVPGPAEAKGEERRYELGQYRAHERAVDACMDWVRCPQKQ